MKHSQTIGIILTISMVLICWFPWVYVADYQLTLNGLHGKVNEGLTFGKQLIPQVFFSFFLSVFFSIKRVWAKRVNLFFGLINLSWAIKNYILFSMCRQGICPEKKLSLYLLPLLAFAILVCTLLPKLKVR